MYDAHYMIYFLLNMYFFDSTTAPSGPVPPHYRGFTITHS